MKIHTVPVIGVSGPLPARKIKRRADPDLLMQHLLRLRAREITHIRMVVHNRPMDYKAVQIRVGQIARSLGIKVKTYMDEKDDLIICDASDDPSKYHRRKA